VNVQILHVDFSVAYVLYNSPDRYIIFTAHIIWQSLYYLLYWQHKYLHQSTICAVRYIHKQECWGQGIRSHDDDHHMCVINSYDHPKGMLIHPQRAHVYSTWFHHRRFCTFWSPDPHWSTFAACGCIICLSSAALYTSWHSRWCVILVALVSIWERSNQLEILFQCQWSVRTLDSNNHHSPLISRFGRLCVLSAVPRHCIGLSKYFLLL
jgi:hypothetical protein